MSTQKRIVNGVETIKETMANKYDVTISSRWQDIKNKMDSVLTSSNAIRSNDALRMCAQLNNMEHEDRVKFIEAKWGKQCLEKVSPMLYHLRQLEMESSK